ncbi:cytochrome P450 [Streptomyces cinnamoneus]|uniref:Cytochrome P450 n=1 Tax=Streptomyces cinnamoneus TaxID=53446 RepID=A0A2G1XPQ1_STRCJ|nr:cytochrome P450 [Streptomyces cinnamoneus]PHQ53214.1 cytochrome P450 [Streptomyces cinnamoneus]PPT16354.1 cytochrome P450 [Streptomyces cinnamoneus]
MKTANRHGGHGWPDIHRIPHPPHRIPFLGDLVGAHPATPVQDTMNIARNLGPIFRRKVFDHEFVFVSDSSMAAELVDESRFRKHVAESMTDLRDIAGDGLATAYHHEPNWQRAHDILVPAFTREALKSYHPTMLAATRRLLDSWDRCVGGAPVDVSRDMTKVTLETIARAGFGYDFGSFERADPHPFVRAMVRALKFSQQNAVEVPYIGSLLTRRAKRRNAQDTALMAEIVDEVVHRRMADGDTGTHDMLGLMLNTAHPETGERLAPANIRNQVITFLVAGHETTAGALSFALYYLVKNPALLAAAREEVARVWGGGADPDPSYEQVTKLRHVRRCLEEALRLWPTAPGFAREALEDTVIGGRHPMRRGAWAVVFTPMLHRDPVWGGDVERFDPDRFTPERVRARPAHVYKPFGTGARVCLGRQFALHEATLVLAMLVHRYELEDHADYQLKVHERLTLMPTGFTLALAHRAHHADGPGAASAGAGRETSQNGAPEPADA